MSVTFFPAVRENVGLLIGMIGGTGSGKTFSAFRLAKGIAGDKPFAVIDTEARRALHYAGQFRFDHADLRAPFRPEAYAEAIREADRAGYPVIIVDSASHEYAGEGGLLDWQEEELNRIAGDDLRKREACKVTSWIKPKMAHKTFIQRLLQVRAHLILCFRAEEKTAVLDLTKPAGKARAQRLVKEGLLSEREIENKRTVIAPAGWQPVCEKNLPYELTTSFLLTSEAPGYPIPLKLQEQHRHLFPPDQQVGEDAGRRITEWARGGSPRPAPVAPTKERLLELVASLKERGFQGQALLDFCSGAVRPDGPALTRPADLSADEVEQMFALLTETSIRDEASASDSDAPDSDQGLLDL